MMTTVFVSMCGEQITQRELARTTGLNLKKVNYCLQKLLEKGYIKFQRVRKNPDKRSYLYILTPAGLKAKSQLTSWANTILNLFLSPTIIETTGL